MRYSVRDNESETIVPGFEAGHIKEGLEYRFFMYRHWSLFEAMTHSSYLAAKLKVFKSQGKEKLLEMLATIGLPLQECHQYFSCIPTDQV